jgi:hypothetical protein
VNLSSAWRNRGVGRSRASSSASTQSSLLTPIKGSERKAVLPPQAPIDRLLKCVVGAVNGLLPKKGLGPLRAACGAGSDDSMILSGGVFSSSLLFFWASFPQSMNTGLALSTSWMTRSVNVSQPIPRCEPGTPSRTVNAVLRRSTPRAELARVCADGEFPGPTRAPTPKPSPVTLSGLARPPSSRSAQQSRTMRRSDHPAMSRDLPSELPIPAARLEPAEIQKGFLCHLFCNPRPRSSVDRAPVS